MDLPYYLPTVRSVACSECRERIGMHLIHSEIRCPHCGATLRTNVSDAYNEGALLFIFAFLAPVGWGLWSGIEWLEVLGSIAFVAAFYLAHCWYRFRLVVWKSGDRPADSLHTDSQGGR